MDLLSFIAGMGAGIALAFIAIGIFIYLAIWSER